MISIEMLTQKSPKAAALVHALRRLAGDTGTVVASQRVLAQQLGVSVQTIARAIEAAELAQHISVQRLGATATGACAYRLADTEEWSTATTIAFRATVLASKE